MEPCIKVAHVRKSYDGKKAIDDISFQVEKNEIFAFLGPNGAGKSTTIALLCTLMELEYGNIVIEGYKRNQYDDQIRAILGVVFQGSMLDNTLSVKQNLLIRCGLYRIFSKQAEQRVRELMEMCQIQEIQHQQVEALSGGQRRRVDIARALIPSPKLLILDEPSTGLDPTSRQDLWRNIKELQKQQQMTIFLTTHYMEEAEIADHICVIDKGHIILDGSREQLIKQYHKDKVILYSDAPKQVVQCLQQKRCRYEIKQSCIEVEIDNFYQLMALLRSVERSIYRVEMKKGTIEDMYLSLLKGEGK